jgi:hypothetical protein
MIYAQLYAISTVPVQNAATEFTNLFANPIGLEGLSPEMVASTADKAFNHVVAAIRADIGIDALDDRSKSWFPANSPSTSTAKK